MTIRKIHSNDVTQNRADIATQYTEIFFDDSANSILLPDPTGLLETKIGANANVSSSSSSSGSSGADSVSRCDGGTDNYRWGGANGP